MNDQELWNLIRKTIKEIEKNNPSDCKEIVLPLRNALLQEGLSANCYVGLEGMEYWDSKCLRWFAGQILDVVDNNHWFAMNSLINTCLSTSIFEIRSNKSLINEIN